MRQRLRQFIAPIAGAIALAICLSNRVLMRVVPMSAAKRAMMATINLWAIIMFALVIILRLILPESGADACETPQR